MANYDYDFKFTVADLVVLEVAYEERPDPVAWFPLPKPPEVTQ